MIISTATNSKNTPSFGNPFEQFQLSQGYLSATAAALFPQPKAFVSSVLMWNTRAIPVCYLPETKLTTADSNVIRAAAQKWETATNNLLSFTGWGTCATKNPTGIKIVIDNTVPNSGVGTESNGVNSANVINGYNASMHLNVFTTKPAPAGFDDCRTGQAAHPRTVYRYTHGTSNFGIHHVSPMI